MVPVPDPTPSKPVFYRFLSKKYPIHKACVYIIIIYTLDCVLTGTYSPIFLLSKHDEIIKLIHTISLERCFMSQNLHYINVIYH